MESDSRSNKGRLLQLLTFLKYSPIGLIDIDYKFISSSLRYGSIVGNENENGPSAEDQSTSTAN